MARQSPRWPSSPVVNCGSRASSGSSLGRNGQNHQLGTREHVRDVGGCGDAGRKGDVLEVLLVTVLQVDLVNDLATPSPKPDLALDAHPAALTWRTGMLIRGPHRLPVRW